MSWINRQIELNFEWLGNFTFNHPKRVLLCILLLLAAVLSQLPHLTIDTSPEGMLHPNDPVRLEYNEFRDQFGTDEIILIAVEVPEELNKEFLAKFSVFQNEIEQKVPYLKDVTSLFNARSTRGENNTLIVEEYLNDARSNNGEIAERIRSASNDPLYRNQYISENGRWLSLVLETDALLEPVKSLENAEFDTPNVEPVSRYLSPKQNSEIVKIVSEIINVYQAPDFRIAYTGNPVILEIFNQETMKNMLITCGGATVILVVSLILFFRRLSGVLLPICIVQLSVLTTLGLMACFGMPFTMSTNTLVPFLYAVGIGDAIHILAIFYRQYEMTENKQDAVIYALKHSGPPVFLTSLTTAGGLISFVFAERFDIAQMGICVATGVMLALFFTVVLLPSVLALFPIQLHVGNKKTSKATNHMLEVVSDFACAYPKQILLSAIAVFLLAFIPISSLYFSNDTLSLFEEDAKIRKDTMLVDRELGGAGVVEVIVDTHEENGLYDPLILQTIDDSIQQVVQYTKSNYPNTVIESGISITDILRETHRALHDNDQAYYRLPAQREAIAQELLLFENSGSDDLERVVDSKFSMARISMKIPYADGVIYYPLLREIEAIFKSTFTKALKATGAEKIDISLTGGMALVGTSIPRTLHSMGTSYVIAFIIVTLLMVLLIGNVKIGLLSMFPNVLPIAMVLGFMGATSTPLDMTTVMIGSIAIGVVVDDTLHFMHTYRRFYFELGDSKRAVKETFYTSGRAMLITSIILCGCFSSNMLGTLANVDRFGFFLALTVALALIGDFLVSPALVILFTKSHQPNKEPSAKKEL